jgi:transcriptional regulator with XRE-family HTH domain
MQRREKRYWLIELRERKGMSQAELARLSDVYRSYIFKLENGEIINPNYHIVMRIAKVLNVSTDRFYK